MGDERTKDLRETACDWAEAIDKELGEPFGDDINTVADVLAGLLAGYQPRLAAMSPETRKRLLDGDWRLDPTDTPDPDTSRDSLGAPKPEPPQE